MPEPPIFALSAIGKRFGHRRILRNLSFEVHGGEFLLLLGGNGAGKTTTLSMMLGILIPTGGRVSVLGADMATERYRVLPRMNFSSPYVGLPMRLTVQENLSVYANLYGLPPGASRSTEIRSLRLSRIVARYGDD